MIVVSNLNTTPIIGLGRIGRLGLLKVIFGSIIVAQAVWDEIVIANDQDDPVVLAANSKDFVEIIPVSDRLAVNVLLDELDLGEAETIVLGMELKADWVLMDGNKGRRKLTELNLPKIGTVGILINARQSGKIPSLSDELVRLRQNGFSLSQTVVDTALLQVGEYHG